MRPSAGAVARLAPRPTFLIAATWDRQHSRFSVKDTYNQRVDAIRSWPEIVGYRFEFLHTGVLAELLRSDFGPSVASALIVGDHIATPVRAVRDIELEPRIGSTRRKADLRFVAERDGGDDLTILVETKVDSVPDWDQLRHLAKASPAGSRFVYLVLGFSEYLLPSAAVKHAFEGHDPQVLAAGDWADILGALDLPPELAVYRRAVQSEVATRESLTKGVITAEGGLPEGQAPQGLRANENGWAERVVWLAQVREQLTNTDGARWETGPCWTYQSSNAVQFGLAPPEWEVAELGSGDHGNVFVEVIANDDFRWLAFKTGGSTPERRATLDGDRIRSVVEEHPELREFSRRRRAAKHHATATAVGIDLSHLSPVVAAECILRAIAAVEDEVLTVVRNAN